MMVALAVVTAILTVIVAVEAAALAEMHLQLEQVRAQLKLSNDPVPIFTDSLGKLYADLLAGVPGAPPITDQGAVLFLSDTCVTCRDLATHLGELAPDECDPLWLLVEAPDAQRGQELLGLSAFVADRSAVDEHAEVAHALGISQSPVVVAIRSGVVLSAAAVSNVGQLASYLKQAKLVRDEGRVGA